MMIIIHFSHTPYESVYSASGTYPPINTRPIRLWRPLSPSRPTLRHRWICAFSGIRLSSMVWIRLRAFGRNFIRRRYFTEYPAGSGRQRLWDRRRYRQLLCTLFLCFGHYSRGHRHKRFHIAINKLPVKPVFLSQPSFRGWDFYRSALCPISRRMLYSKNKPLSLCLETADLKLP